VWHVADTVFAVGSGGVVLRSIDGGASFETLDAGVTTDLTTVVGRDADHAIAAGASAGVITTGDGGDSWQPGSSAALSSLWAIPNGPIYAVSANVVQASDDEGMSFMADWGGFNLFSNLKDVWASDTEHVIAVTLGGVVYSKNGADWSYYAPLPARPIYALWGRDPSDIFAVGENGHFLRSDGATSCTGPGLTVDLFDVHGSDGRVFLVGEAGTIASCTSN
jgi:photosystem II stability/assembly factor-like uncharacterized protein